MNTPQPPSPSYNPYSPYHQRSRSAGQQPQYGPPARGNVPPPPPNLPPQEPKTPWWQREGVIGKLLAGLGVLVTLIGVVMMLALAAKAGYFGPGTRVASGTALSLGLIGVGVWLNGRTGGRIGAVALATTGFAGLFMVVVAVTTYYEWLTPPVGLTVAGLVAAGAVALSTWWGSQPMTILAVLAIAGLAPVLTGGLTLTLIGFLLLLQVAAIVPEKARGWFLVGPVRTIPVVIALIAAESTGTGSFAWRVTAAAVCAAAGLVPTMVLSARRIAPIDAAVWAAATAPMLAVLPAIDRPLSIVAAAALAAVTVIAMAMARPLHPITQAVGMTIAAVSALEACFDTTRGQWLPALIAVVALGLFAAAHQLRSIVAWGFGIGFGLLAFVTQVVLVTPVVLVHAGFAADHLGNADLIAGLAVFATALAFAVTTPRVTGSHNSQLHAVVTAAPAFWGLVVAILSAGVAVHGEGGYHVAQLVVSATLMVAAMLALAAGLRDDTNAAACTLAGLGFVGGSLAKLFLFDLAALDGLIRAGSFLAVGLLLLAAGARYAQAVAQRAGHTLQEPVPTPIGQPQG